MSASSSRTALAYASRSTTRFYTVFVVVVVIAGPPLLPGVIAAVPVAALADVIVYAALTSFVALCGVTGECLLRA